MIVPHLDILNIRNIHKDLNIILVSYYCSIQKILFAEYEQNRQVSSETNSVKSIVKNQTTITERKKKSKFTKFYFEV